MKIRFNGAILLLVSLAFLTGCASSHMKGTPFFTGEYEVRQGPVEDRINGWPLLYYRDPALSILWPLIEKTDDHFAFRPLMSIYGLHNDKPVYNVLWPIMRFDGTRGKYRVFPIWNYKKYNPGYKHSFIWPGFIGFKDIPREKGWHLFPVAGSYVKKRDMSYYRYFMYPLGHQWKTRSGNKGNAFFPLWGYERNKQGTFFLSMLYSHDLEKSGDGWQLLMPLYYRSRYDNDKSFLTLLGGRTKDGDYSSWYVTPLLSGGSKDANSSDLWLVGPLAHFGRDRNESTSHILPIYASKKDHDGSKFISLLYSRDRKTGGDGWDLLMPLYYSSLKDGDRSIATLLGGYKKTQDGSSWMAVPLLSGGKKDANGKETWIVGPLAHFEKNKESKASHIAPLYYKSTDKAGSRFFSIPWSYGSGLNGNSWQVSPLLYTRIKKADSDKVITPVFAAGKSDADNKKWHSVIPVYYRSKSDSESVVATLLGGYAKTENGGSWLLYPLLSWGKRDDKSGEFWGLAPVLHAKWDAQSTSHHLLPLYYWNSKDKTLISPLAARWKSGDTTHTLVTPLLSMKSKREKRSDLWVAGPLAHWSWGEEAGGKHILPLMYSDKKKGTFASLPYSKWKSDDGKSTTHLIPPALSWMSKSEKRKDLWAVGPLLHASWGEEAGGSHLFPLYYGNKKKDSFASLLYATWKQDGATIKFCPPLLSWRKTDGEYKELNLLLGLIHDEQGNGEREGYTFPLYAYKGKKEFYSPLFGWNQRNNKRSYFYPLTPLLGFHNKDYSGGWLFPVVSHRKSDETGNYNGNFLWGFYSKNNDRTRSSFFPLFGYENNGSIEKAPPLATKYKRYGKKFQYLILGWHNNTLIHQPDYKARKNGDKDKMLDKRTVSNGFFPLWTYKKKEIEQEDTENVKGSFLLCLYDYKRDVKQIKGEKDDYRRSRVLWRLWHYENHNDEVSVDIFPAITYDKTEDVKQVSFLWRLFRYRRDKEGKKLDILFIPLMRTKGDAQ